MFAHHWIQIGAKRIKGIAKEVDATLCGADNVIQWIKFIAFGFPRVFGRVGSTVEADSIVVGIEGAANRFQIIALDKRQIVIVSREKVNVVVVGRAHKARMTKDVSFEKFKASCIFVQERMDSGGEKQGGAG
jgi:hypothetical protein